MSKLGENTNFGNWERVLFNWERILLHDPSKEGKKSLYMFKVGVQFMANIVGRRTVILQVGVQLYFSFVKVGVQSQDQVSVV